jgi:hypothetical protein
MLRLVATRALCVGVNDYPIEGADLKGCVNDAHAWARLLADHFDAASGDVDVLLNADAKKAAILAALDRLLAGARKGDVVVFTNSSHGTYLADRDGDEPDRYDEALCPWDVQDNPIPDDELREHLDKARKGVHVTVISDSCHSGTGTRAPPPMQSARPRFLDPSVLGLPTVRDAGRAKPRAHSRSESSIGELYLAGCRSDQFSYDARIGRKYHGAMTYHAVRIITEANHSITYQQLEDRLVPALAAARFDQEPQLEGTAANKRRQVFR